MARNGYIAAPVAAQQSRIEAMPCPVFILGHDGRYLACNRHFLTFLGRSAEQVVGVSAAGLQPVEAADAFEQQASEVWVLRRPLSRDAVFLRGDGALRQVRFHRSILYSDTGEALGIIGVMEDVTDDAPDALALLGRMGAECAPRECFDGGVA